MTKTSIFFCTFFLFAVTTTVAQTNQSQAIEKDIVKTADGLLQGFTDSETGLHDFWGVPYAQPPVGKLRWRAPQPLKPWKGIRQANHFGPKAMQKPIFSDMRFRTDSTSEDCLYLNVWTPAHASNANLPVLVYFYGGGFIAGDGSEWRYDGASLANKGMVVVTVNYRLGIFGFFAHPALTKESPHHSSGNYGLLDQQAALAWVHKNIAAFGGNPNRITIGGESAGSISVFAQMASPLSRNLIAGVIGESGAMIPPTFPAVPLKQVEKSGLAFAQKIGAHTLKDLRAIPTKKLLDEASKPGMFHLAATIDGYFFPKSPVTIFEEGKQAHVPLLVGWNSTESNYFGILRGKMPTPENYKQAINGLYKDYAADILRLYPGKSMEQVIQSATELSSDRFIVYSTWKWAEMQRKTGGNPVYRYLFCRPRPAPTSGETSESKLPTPMKGAAHSWEIEYALGNLSTNKTYAWTPDDYKVSVTMEDYFANFIKTGDPNGAHIPFWMGNLKGRPVMVMNINVNSQLKPEKRRKQHLYLDSLYMKK